MVFNKKEYARKYYNKNKGKLNKRRRKRYQETGHYKEYHMIWNKKNSKNLKERKYKIKKYLVDYKGGGCMSCSYNKCLDALEFHHIDSKQKDFNVCSNLSTDIEKLKKEADKCLLLCANCHREIHHNSQ